LNINNLSILAVRDKNLITEDEILKDGEEIELIEVISGG
jgi:sulfur carrier protein ThiS